WRPQSRAGTGHLVYSVCDTPKLKVTQKASNKSALNFQNSATGETALPDTGETRHENWLFSPMFDFEETLSIHVGIVFQNQHCGVGPDFENGHGMLCHESIDLMVQYSTKSQNGESQNRFNLLHKVSNEENKSTTDFGASNPFKSITIQFRSQKGWFQLALRDRGACILVDHLTVFHLACALTQVDQHSTLRRVPLQKTRAGHTSEVRFVKGQCIEGAALKNLSAGFVESSGAQCLPNGKWRFKMETECICQKGYEFLIGIGTCQSCPRGTYKQHTGNHKCSVCPLNSVARDYGQNRCECLPGYFRLSVDSAESETMDCYGTNEVQESLLFPYLP
ncbi:hypothetical protein T265_14075, partial [Opisthorchis viverrini]